MPTAPLPALPRYSNQFTQSPPQGDERSHRKLGKGIKIFIWIVCSIFIGISPFLAIAFTAQLHSQTLSFTNLLINGDLIGISIAVFGDIFGQTIIILANRNHSNSCLINLTIILVVLIPIALLFAFIVLTNFIDLANCNQQHPNDAASICSFLGVSNPNIFYYSIGFFIACILLGLGTKMLEENK